MRTTRPGALELLARAMDARAQNRLRRALLRLEGLTKHPDVATDLEVGALVHRELARALFEAGRFDAACEHYHQAAARARELGFDSLLAGCWGELGAMLWAIGRTEDAVRVQARAMLLHQRLDDHDGIAATFYALGLALEDLGRTAEAVRAYRRGIPHARACGDAAMAGLLTEQAEACDHENH